MTTRALKSRVPFAQNIHYRFQECLLVLFGPAQTTPPFVLNRWVPPPLCCIKINADATISTSKAAFATFSKDHLGVVVKVWARILPTSPPPPFFFKTRLRPSLGRCNLLSVNVRIMSSSVKL